MTNLTLEQLAQWHHDRAISMRYDPSYTLTAYDSSDIAIRNLDAIEFHEAAARLARAAIASVNNVFDLLRAGGGEPALGTQGNNGSPAAPGPSLSELRARLITTAAALSRSMELLARREDESADMPWLQQQLARAEGTLEHAQ